MNNNKQKFIKPNFLITIFFIGLLSACETKIGKGPVGTKENLSSSDKPVLEKNSDAESMQYLAYVNTDSLEAHYNYYLKVKSRLEAKGKSMDKDLQTKGASFQEKVAKYQKDSPAMSVSDRENRERILAKEQQDLASTQQKMAEQMSLEQMDEFNKLYNRINAFLAEYAKTRGYKMVVQYSNSNRTFLYADPDMDITPEVISGLNDAYKKEVENIKTTK